MKLKKCLATLIFILVFTSMLDASVTYAVTPKDILSQQIDKVKGSKNSILKKSIKDALLKLDKKIKSANNLLGNSKQLLSNQPDSNLQKAVDNLSSLMNTSIDKKTISAANLESMCKLILNLGNAIQEVNTAQDQLIAKLCKDCVEPLKVNYTNLTQRKESLIKEISRYDEAAKYVEDKSFKSADAYTNATDMLSKINDEFKTLKEIKSLPTTLDEYNNVMTEIGNMYNLVNSSQKSISDMESAYKDLLNTLYNQKIGPYYSNLDGLKDVQTSLETAMSNYKAAKGDTSASQYMAAEKAWAAADAEMKAGNELYHGIPSSLDQYVAMCDEIANMFNVRNNSGSIAKELTGLTESIGNKKK